MSIKLKKIKLLKIYLLAANKITKQNKLFIGWVIIKFYQLKQTSAIKKIFSVYSNYVDLTIRRSCAFVLDALIIFSILIVIESAICLLLLYSDSGYSIYIDVFNSNTTLFFHRYFHLVIYFLVVGFSLSRMNGSALGYRIFKIKLLSSNKLVLSVVGSILRSFLPFFIPFIYFTLVFFPYLFKLIPYDLPQLELTILMSLILIWPISIVLSKGTVSVYDLLLSTKVVRQGHSENKNESGSHIYIAILATVAFSLMATTIIHNRESIARASIIGEKFKGDYYPSIINKNTMMTYLDERIFNHKNGNFIQRGIFINRIGSFDSGEEDECEINGAKWKIVVLLKINDEKTQQWLVSTIQSSLIELNLNLEDYEIITKKFVQVNLVNMSIFNNYRYDKDWGGYILLDKYKVAGIQTMF